MLEEEKLVNKENVDLEAKLEKEENAIGIEIRGLERVLPEDRKHTTMIDNLTMWFSADFSIAPLANGSIGLTYFALSLSESITVVVITNFVVLSVVSYFATFGPRLGLRQFIVSRYSFGWYPNKIMGILSSITSLGWSCVNVISAGLLLTSASDDRLPAWASILILAVLTSVIGIFGYKWVHRYERFAWFPLLIAFSILLGLAAPDIANVPDNNADYPTRIGNVLSYTATVISMVGWCTAACDFNVNMPEDSNMYLVWLYTFVGTFVPTVFLMISGLLIVTTAQNVPAYAAALGVTGNVPALMQTIYTAKLGGFGRFLTILVALSVVQVNIANDYSLGLSLQVGGPAFFQKVPRWFWTLFGSVLYIVVACFGANSYVSTLSNFLPLVGYWVTIYVTIVFIEDVWFRRGKYDATAWNNINRLPHGYAAGVAFCIGIVGAGLGMNQAWAEGPLSKAVGPVGADIGTELGVGFSALSYLLLRPLEAKFTGRFKA
ncbi:hypothetical protein HDU93_005374 [Gonapodya sp. JEL0774]|nr:hypothetical protein HDU93_005374 [Gonapodya sp. JEL0774]